VVAFLFEKAGADVYSFNQQMHNLIHNIFKTIKLEQQVDVLEVCSSMNPICCGAVLFATCTQSTGKNHTTSSTYATDQNIV